MRVQLQPTYYNYVTLQPEEVQSYHENGYLITKNLMPPGDIHEVRRDAINIFKRQLARHGFHPQNYETFESDLYSFFKKDQEAFINCGKHMQHTVSLHKLSLCPQILEVLKKIGLSTVTICTRPVLFANSKYLATKDIYHTIPAHQDMYSMQGSENSVVVWLPLINVNKNLGALQIVPESHTRGLMTSSVVEGFGMVDRFKDEDFISLELDVGDAVFFSSFLVHRSGNNTTDSIRWSANFRYNDIDDANFIDRKFPHPYLYQPISKLK
jgi:phytanoyl-CoA hydroxylase